MNTITNKYFTTKNNIQPGLKVQQTQTTPNQPNFGGRVYETITMCGSPVFDKLIGYKISDNSKVLFLGNTFDNMMLRTPKEKRNIFFDSIGMLEKLNLKNDIKVRSYRRGNSLYGKLVYGRDEVFVRIPNEYSEEDRYCFKDTLFNTFWGSPTEFLQQVYKKIKGIVNYENNLSRSIKSFTEYLDEESQLKKLEEQEYIKIKNDLGL